MYSEDWVMLGVGAMLFALFVLILGGALYLEHTEGVRDSENARRCIETERQWIDGNCIKIKG